MDTFVQIKETGIIAVLRNLDSGNAIDIAEVLVNNGVSVLEITMETPNAISIIENIKSKFQKSVVIGAGTVLDPETARTAIISGAQFIFSPTVNVETIRMTKRYGLVSIPGALTPTEILKAYENGANAVKVFPIKSLGASYLKDVKGPLSHVPLVPTGGIDVNNLQEYFRAGATAVGVGSSLVNLHHKNEPDFLQSIEMKAREFVRQFNNFKKEKEGK
ncbi:bifunctional 4-hydroxy-2-oxoglutarate aldolase/2-dehydro-3-deoxy-phosphogluconate aldolase [Virgibacillus oceani]